MEPWRHTSLLSPPVHTTKIEGHIDLTALRNICDNCTRVLSKQSPLHRESALLSRFIYKYDKKFRSDIGYRNLKKTNTALRKYLQICLLKDVQNFIAALPSEDDDYMPTRQMLEFVLVRYMTFSKLMLRICMCSKQAAIFYFNRVKNGENHWMSLMPYALLCRIWSMCSVLLQHTISWYSSLYPFLVQLLAKGLSFLPVDYQLPHNLADWLDVQNLDTFGKFEWSQKKSQQIDVFFNDDDDGFDSILNYANLINNDEDEEINTDDIVTVRQVKTVVELPVAQVTKRDHGQAISRESYKMMNNPILPENRKELIQEKYGADNVLAEQFMSKDGIKVLTNFQKKINNKNQSTHYFGRVTNSKSLEDFLVKEETFRNDGDKQSLTSHLSFMQWLTLKTALLKVCESISNRKLDRKFQKVWKEKCLDYL